MNLLERKEGFIQVIVAERCSDANLRDDALQEGRIALWKQADKGRSDAYLHTVVRRAVTDSLSRDLWTGRPEGRTAKPIDPMRQRRDPLVEDLHDRPGRTEVTPMAFHQREIHQAVKTLSPEGRRYCLLRFWLGHTNPEAAREMGTTASTLDNRWLRTHRPALLAQLGHLQAA